MAQKDASLARNNAQSRIIMLFLRRVYIVMALLAVLGLTIATVFVFIPLQKALKDSLADNYKRTVDIKFAALKEAMSSCQQGAQSLSSRTMIKNALHEYDENIIDLEELKSYTQDKYVDGAEALDFLILAQRRAGSDIIARFERQLSQEHECFFESGLTDGHKIANGIYLCQDKVYYLIYTTISEAGKTLGSDELVFDLTGVLQTLQATDDGRIMLMTDELLTELSEGAIQLDQVTGQIVNKSQLSIYVSKPVQEGLYFVSQTTSGELFSLPDTLRRQMLPALIALLLSMIVIVNFFVVRYARKDIDFLEGDNISLRQIASEADFDVLTAARNRRFGEKLLVGIFKEFQAGKDNPLIMLFDIDKFKTINDLYGHHAGDMVLVQIVQLITETIRQDDYLIRWGGDEFLGVFPQVNSISALNLGRKICRRVSEHSFVIDDISISLTISIGLSFFTQQDKSWLDAVQRADQALLAAKREGKDTISFTPLKEQPGKSTSI